MQIEGHFSISNQAAARLAALPTRRRFIVHFRLRKRREFFRDASRSHFRPCRHSCARFAQLATHIRIGPAPQEQLRNKYRIIIIIMMISRIGFVELIFSSAAKFRSNSLALFARRKHAIRSSGFSPRVSLRSLLVPRRARVRAPQPVSIIMANDQRQTNGKKLINFQLAASSLLWSLWRAASVARPPSRNYFVTASFEQGARSGPPRARSSARPALGIRCQFARSGQVVPHIQLRLHSIAWPILLPLNGSPLMSAKLHCSAKVRRVYCELAAATPTCSAKRRAPPDNNEPPLFRLCQSRAN